MIKRIILIIFVFVLLSIFFNYQNKNQDARKILDPKNGQVIQDTISLNPSASTTQPTSIPNLFLEIIEPKNNATVSNQAITVTGKTIPNGFIFVNDQEFKADSNGSFSTTVILEEGENYILVVVSDEYGNSREKDLLVNLEST